jgi:hypothetical protein
MGNGFTAHGSSTGPDELYLSNGGTDAFLDVLTLSGCALAETPWQQNLVLHFADGHRYDRGFFPYRSRRRTGETGGRLPHPSC